METIVYIAIIINAIGTILIAINLFFFNAMKKTIDAIAAVFVPED